MKTFSAVVFANYVLRALLAASLFLPFARLIAASGITHFPAGDRLLFQPSGLYLLELLRLSGPELVALAEGSLWLLLGVSAILLLARALTFQTLIQRRFDLVEIVPRALRLVPGYLLIAGLVLLAQVLALTIFLWAGAGVSRLFEARSERSADLAFAALSLLGLFVALVLGVVGELARASLAHERQSGLSALGRGLEHLARAPVRLLSRWAGLGAAGLVLVVAAAKLCELLDVSREAAWRAAAVFGVHQLVILALVGLQTAWLVIALRAARERPL